MNRNENQKSLKKYFLGPFLCLPRASLELFTISVGGSVLLTLIFSLIGGSVHGNAVNAIRSPILDKLSAFWLFDPIFWLFIISLISSILIFLNARVVKGVDLWSRTIASTFPFLIVLIVFAVGEFLIKTAFSVHRPPDPLPEPQLTLFIERILNINFASSKPDSMPSGFVMRQVSAFLFLTWLIIKLKISITSKSVFEAINVFALILVSFSRIYRGAHTLLDVAVAIGVGTMIFWLLILLPFYLISVKDTPIEKIYLSTLTGGTLILFLISLGFSNNAAALIQLYSITLIILGVIYFISPLFNISSIPILPRD